MAQWYVGSVQYNAVPQWAASTAYTVGQFVRQLAAPTVGQERIFRCTTAGTTGGTEPSWGTSNGSTTNSGTAVFTEVTGKPTYAWTTPHKSLQGASFQGSAGDTYYVANNHNFTGSTSSVSFGAATTAYIICVNPSGSVPPVAADLSTGGIDGSSTTQYFIDGSIYVYGVTFSAGGGNNLVFAQGSGGEVVLENCTLILTSTSSGGNIQPHYANGGSYGQIVRWKNVTVKFNHNSQHMAYGEFMWEWLSGTLDCSAVVPTTPFRANKASGKHYFSGVDFSGLSSAAMFDEFSGSQCFQFVNCKLPANYTFYSTYNSSNRNRAFVDMVISDNGNNNYKHERYAFDGSQIVELVIVRSGGANDGTRTYSWKLSSSVKAQYSSPFETFTGVLWNAAVGTAKTLTFEIISNLTLKDNEISANIEYLGTVGSMKSTLISTTPSGGILAAGSALSASGATWVTTGLGAPTAQKITATFTPQVVGYIRWRICLHKASTTIYVDPAPVLT